MREAFLEALRSGCAEAGVALPNGVDGLAADHFELLSRWNRRMNLSRFDSVEEAAVFHYAESLVLAAEALGWVRSAVDIGSGAGFPGLMLAWFRPDVAVTLVESHQRKAVFLKEASRALGNVRVFSGRVEDLMDGFDLAVSRAVARTEIYDQALRLSRGFLVLASCGEQGEWEAGVAKVESRRLPWGRNRCLLKSVADDPGSRSE